MLVMMDDAATKRERSSCWTAYSTSIWAARWSF